MACVWAGGVEGSVCWRGEVDGGGRVGGAMEG